MLRPHLSTSNDKVRELFCLDQATRHRRYDFCWLSVVAHREMKQTNTLALAVACSTRQEMERCQLPLTLLSSIVKISTHSGTQKCRSRLKLPFMALSCTVLVLLATVAFSFRSAVAAAAVSSRATKVCVVGSGIGGSSVAHFLKQYTCAQNSETPCVEDIRVFERRGKMGGRMATVSIDGDTFEAGASIIHPKNLHAARFARLLNLNTKTEDDADSNPKSNVSSSSSWFGIWDGSRFVFQTLAPPSPSSSAIYRKMYPLLNSLILAWRYGFSLLRMDRFVKEMVERFMLYYSDFESRPVFETVDEMLKWSGLYGLTRRTLHAELADAGMSSRLISELVTV